MSQDTHFSDEPLPGMEPQTKLAGQLVDEASSTQAGQGDTGLHNPDLQPQSAYGHSDPASLAAVQEEELASPDLHEVIQDTPADPNLRPSVSEALADPTLAPDPVVAPDVAIPSADFTNWDPHLAHLAQVGLIAADQWDEQFKPRIDQLHEDIDQVNEQLDDLEKAHRKTKKS